MFRSFFLCIVLLAGRASYCTPVLLKAPQTPEEEFSAYIQTEDVVAYSTKQMQKIQEQSEAIRSLTMLLEQAQKSFVKDHLKQSGDYFRSIIKQAYKKDWMEEAQKIIFYSFLRLAQIEWKGLEAEAFLYSASVFAPHLDPDANLFPPPLIQKFQAIKKNQSRIPISLKQVFPFHEVVLINGRVVSGDTRLPYGEYRVTALSSSHKGWSRVISLSRLVQKRIITVPLVGGHCRKPVFFKGVDRKHQVLFPDFCLWADHVTDPLKMDSTQLYMSNEVQKNVKDLENKSHKWKSYQKWGVLAVIGITVATTAIILMNNEKEVPKTKPPKKIIKGFP